MNKRAAIISSIFCVVAVIIVVIIRHQKALPDRTISTSNTSTNSSTTMSIAPTTGVTELKLTSIVFAEGEAIPDLYTCKGQDVSPPLTISGVPTGAKSLILTMEDPDTSIGNFDHWIIFDMPPTTTDIPAASEPRGVHGLTTSGDLHYVGPCPPSGVHRYIFSVYALDTMLGLPEGSKKDAIMKSAKNHIIGMTKLIGMYGK